MISLQHWRRPFRPSSRQPKDESTELNTELSTEPKMNHVRMQFPSGQMYQYDVAMTHHCHQRPPPLTFGLMCCWLKLILSITIDITCTWIHDLYPFMPMVWVARCYRRFSRPATAWEGGSWCCRGWSRWRRCQRPQGPSFTAAHQMVWAGP